MKIMLTNREFDHKIFIFKLCTLNFSLSSCCGHYLPMLLLHKMIGCCLSNYLLLFCAHDLGGARYVVLPQLHQQRRQQPDDPSTIFLEAEEHHNNPLFSLTWLPWLP